MVIVKKDLEEFIQRNRMQDCVVCLHSSLKSFGKVAGGAQSVIDAFLESGCTLVCPSFFYESAAFPQKNYRQNGMDFESIANNTSGMTFPCINYEEQPGQIDKSMGIIPKTLLTLPTARRTKNAMNSFCVAGPKAEELVNGKTPNIVDSVYTAYTVYKNIFSCEKEKSYILLAGVDFTSCTPIHFAEEVSGKKQFRRWALYKSKITETEVGSCSDGFEALRPYLQDLEATDTVGNAKMRIYPFKEFIVKAAQVIKENPSLTMCSSNCGRCADMSRGGFFE